MLDYSTTYFGEKMLGSIVAVLIVYLLSIVALRLLQKWVHNPDVLYATRKRVIYGATVFGVILVATIWADVLSGFTTFLGIIGAGVALALKDPLTSIAGRLYLAVVRPYSLGDRIEMDDLKGDVVDIGVFHTTLLEVGGWVGGEQSTGRLANIPHNWLFTKKLFNFTKAFPFIWTELNIMITFESNWQRALKIVTERSVEICSDTPEKATQAIRSATNRYLIKIGTLTPIVYTTVGEEGVKLTARFLTPVRMRRSRESQLYEAILEDFALSEDITLAYPTYRIVKK